MRNGKELNNTNVLLLLEEANSRLEMRDQPGVQATSLLRVRFCHNMGKHSEAWSPMRCAKANVREPKKLCRHFQQAGTACDQSREKQYVE
jgi:hypothetical protein